MEDDGKGEERLDNEPKKMVRSLEDAVRDQLTKKRKVD